MYTLAMLLHFVCGQKPWNWVSFVFDITWITAWNYCSGA